MKALTLRNIPPEVDRQIQGRAQEKGVSLNKAAISLLEEATGYRAPTGGRKRVYHDLDHLFGSWSKQTADEFSKALAKMRTIDKEMWKCLE